MRKLITPHGKTIWLSAHDTYQWAHTPGAAWPCSFLAGKRLVAGFAANGDLVDLAINGGRGNQDCPNDELLAITSDFFAA